jgi:hypothetical protein
MQSVATLKNILTLAVNKVNKIIIVYLLLSL